MKIIINLKIILILPKILLNFKKWFTPFNFINHFLRTHFQYFTFIAHMQRSRSILVFFFTLNRTTPLTSLSLCSIVYNFFILQRKKSFRSVDLSMYVDLVDLFLLDRLKLSLFGFKKKKKVFLASSSFGSCRFFLVSFSFWNFSVNFCLVSENWDKSYIHSRDKSYMHLRDKSYKIINYC
jgi:hypothetical protein